MKPLESMRRFLEAFSATGAETLEQRLTAAEAANDRLAAENLELRAENAQLRRDRDLGAEQ